jgi:hypothetical protein
MHVLLECCYIWMESSQWENWNHLFCRNVSFFYALHSQFRSVCHGMKQTYLHMWYPLFKLNGIDAISEITKSRIIQWTEINGSGIASFRFSWEVNKGTSWRQVEHSLYPWHRLSVEKHAHQSKKTCCQSKTRACWWFQFQRTYW